MYFEIPLVIWQRVAIAHSKCGKRVLFHPMSRFFSSYVLVKVLIVMLGLVFLFLNTDLCFSSLSPSSYVFCPEGNIDSHYRLFGRSQAWIRN